MTPGIEPRTALGGQIEGLLVRGRDTPVLPRAPM